ncbi:MAG: MFS transporter [Elusimicrobium sp.]|uniref:MFS transporter n=1 Tax=Candidatus Avelusimicrobium gallicola TaxID=2562704 RepID=A0A928DPB5_9BACT|nr:MFS transporter [Elusimicrobium sp.]
MNIKIRLTVMNFLQFGLWGAYLTSMGTFLAGAGFADKIGLFYATQGFVSIFMPALVGIVADRWVPAQKMLGLCHLLAAAAIAGAGYAGAQPVINFGVMFTLYTVSVAFYMPTIALSNSVAYTVLRQNNMDTVKVFPPIRVFGTVGFICAMLTTNFAGFQTSYTQWYFSGILGLLLGVYCFTLPACPVATTARTLAEALGLKAFALFKEKKMAIFFIFSMLLGMSLQITNGFAGPFITGFNSLEGFAGSWGANNANALISLSQISETLCILLIPFFLKRYGIKKVMLISMFAWFLRFGFLGIGNPTTATGIVFLVASMIVYGVAFDFFNVSGSLYVDQETDPSIRSSAQGVFMLMTNGLGAAIGSLAAQKVINSLVNVHMNPAEMVNGVYPTAISQQIMQGWSNSWFVFAGFSLVVAILFAIIFKYKHTPAEN